MAGRVSNNITVEPFSPAEFERLAGASCEGTTDGPAADQVGYVSRYMEWLGAKSIVVEQHYVDRHFREEFDLYYSRLLNPPTTHCRRLHFFTKNLSREALGELLERALDDKEGIESELSGAYLGFVVLRPVPHAVVGRSLLAFREDSPEREIHATTKLSAHLMGLELSVRGTAFQQQDRAVGACATAAVWMAMSRVARLDGARSPSPAFIARAAARMAGTEGRFLPSRGLTIPQVTDAIRECGYEPESFRSAPNPGEFLHHLHCYLRSGIPAVLVVARDNDEEAHAVTAVGYRLGVVRPELEIDLLTRSRRINRIYVHDDRLGPYARATLSVEHLPAQPEDIDAVDPTPAVLSIAIHVDDRHPEDQEAPLRVRCAIIPVSPRLRLPAQDLMAVGWQYERLMDAAGAGFGAENETFFLRAGKYLDDLHRLRRAHTFNFDPTALGQFLGTVALPRWVCVSRWWNAGGAPLADFLLDTTDLFRGGEVNRNLLGIVAFDPAVRDTLRQAASDWRVPSLA
ncbi:MAG: hypothetical protein QM817_40835 [Archangium sp.]